MYAVLSTVILTEDIDIDAQAEPSERETLGISEWFKTAFSNRMEMRA